MAHFKTDFGGFHLNRLPIQKNKPLQAWDAADEYLLSHLHTDNWLQPENTILVVNDGFGTLSTALHSYQLHHWSDSLLAQQACVINFKNNKLTPLPTFINSIDTPQNTFDLVMIKVPKNLTLLEDQLIRIKSCLHKDTKIIASAMTKYLPKSALQLFEDILGKTTTSLAKKKARLVFCQHSKPASTSPYPQCYTEPSTQLTLYHHANVFSKDRLDVDTQFMLEQFSSLPSKKHIVDLGCGNGVLGIMAQRQYPQAALSFLDESHMAVASSRINYQHAFPGNKADFLVSDCLSALTHKVDLVICNPPSHQHHSAENFIAWQMFSQSHQRLNPKGELWVVDSHHLHYHKKLKKIFGNCTQVATDKKIIIVKSVK